MNQMQFIKSNFYSPLKFSIMLRWSVIFLVIAIIAGIFGFFGIAASAASIAKTLFFIFVIVFDLLCPSLE